MSTTSTIVMAPLVVALVVTLGACGGGEAARTEPTAPLADTCKLQIAPRASALGAPPKGAAAVTPSRSSRLIAHVELKLASVAKELEGKVPSRLAEERNK